MNVLKTLAIASAFALSASIAQAGGWKSPPSPEWPEQFDSKSEANAAFKEYKKDTLKGWLDGVLGWKNDRLGGLKEDFKEAKAKKKAGEISKEEFKEIKAENRAKAKALKEAKKEAKRSAREARKEAKQEAKDRCCSE